VELLTAAVPALSCLAILVDPANPATTPQLEEVQRAAQVLGLRPLVLEARGPKEFANAFAAASHEHAEAMVILRSAPMVYNATYLAEFAANARLPATYVDRVFPEAGGLMSYGPDLTALFRRAAYYVDRILKGARPADLPVEQPMTIDFVINLKTARALGLAIPEHVLLQATEVIQ
jgi:putative ABC transport system substrate-binding protein